MEREENMIASIENDIGEDFDVAIDCNIPVSRMSELVQLELAELSGADIYQVREIISHITSLLKDFFAQDSFSGTADDWHNFAVDVARHDLQDLACDILEKGLQEFARNTDLLADYLKYGIACGRIEQCKNYYKVLAKIPKVRYTWRSYSFSIDWLQYLWETSDSEKELGRLQGEMQKLIASFRQNIPDNEESYNCEADFFRMIRQPKEEERVLQNALAQLQVAPKCALRLADILFNRGEYEAARMQMQHGINATETQASINVGYLYYLLGLTDIALVLRDGITFDETMTNEIYKNFNMALSLFDTRLSYKKTMRDKTKMIINQSNIEVDGGQYEELANLLDSYY